VVGGILTSCPFRPPAAGADPVTPVAVITDDPYANVTPPDYKLSYALKEAEQRAQANPAAYGQPYVNSGVIVIPVTTEDVRAEAERPLTRRPSSLPLTTVRPIPARSRRRRTRSPCPSRSPRRPRGRPTGPA
jgi:hypothetical protein